MEVVDQVTKNEEDNGQNFAKFPASLQCKEMIIEILNLAKINCKIISYLSVFGENKQFILEAKQQLQVNSPVI